MRSIFWPPWSSIIKLLWNCGIFGNFCLKITWFEEVFHQFRYQCSFLFSFLDSWSFYLICSWKKLLSLPFTWQMKDHLSFLINCWVFFWFWNEFLMLKKGFNCNGQFFSSNWSFFPHFKCLDHFIFEVHNFFCWRK